jgi:hypothetical protein
MKLTKYLILPLIATTSALGTISFNEIGVPYTQDFNTFNGSEGSLPSGFSIDAGGTDVFRGIFNSNTDSADDFTGIMAATSDGVNFALAWRESTGSAGLDNARILLALTNNTGVAISSFELSYEVQSWVNGRRDNRVRSKYDVILDDGPDGRATFETDLFSTTNPNHAPIAANGDQFVLDGSLADNKELVSRIIDLTTLLIDEGDPDAGTFGLLQPGETAYFRWQISNADLTAGNRSALAIDNLSITAIPEPSTYAMFFGLLAFAGVIIRRRLK